MKVMTKLIIGVVILIAVTILAIKYVLPFFTPFLIALLLACIIEPPVMMLERRSRLSRGTSVLIVLSLFVIIITMFLAVSILEITLELKDLSENLPMYEKAIGDFFNTTLEKIDHLYKGLPKPIVQAVDQNRNDLGKNAEALVKSVLGFITGLPNALILGFLTIIATYFISKDRRKIMDFFLIFVPKESHKDARRLEDEVESAIMGFIRAQFILITITALITLVGLSILGVNYAWVLGIAAGLLDLIPMIGPAALFLPWILYEFLTGEILFGLSLTLVFGVQMITRQVAEAKIVGKNIGVHPLASLMSVYVGIKLFGPNGFLIGPITVIVLKAVINGSLLPLYNQRKKP